MGAERWPIGGVEVALPPLRPKPLSLPFARTDDSLGLQKLERSGHLDQTSWRSPGRGPGCVEETSSWKGA